MEESGADQNDHDKLFENEQQDFKIALARLNLAIEVDSVAMVEKIMNQMRIATQIVFLLPNGLFKAPILTAIEYGSMKCLRHVLHCHRELKHFIEDVGIDQEDGFIDIGRGSQNAYHLVAMLEGEAAYEAVGILEEYPSLLTCILNKPDENGIPPLFTALKNDNATVAISLVRCGASFDQNIEALKTSPIKTAVTNGQVEVLEEMIKATGQSRMSQLFTNSKLFGEGHTILYAAAASGCDDIFRILFEKMGEKQAETNLIKEMSHQECQLFLEYICTSGMTLTMEKLMNLDEQWAVGRKKALYERPVTPLMWAAKGDQIEMAKLILNSKFKTEIIELEDKYGRNVFHYAAAVNKSQVLKYLITWTMDQCDSSPSNQDDRAAVRKQHKYSQFQNKRDKRGCPPLHLAAVAGLRENVELLLKDDISLLKESIFHCQDCIKKSSYEMLKLILEKYISRRFTYFFQIQNERNRTPLHEAAFAGRTDILKLLLERGASVESRSAKYKQTALHFAVAGKSLPAVQFLVKYSKDMIHWRTIDDKTPTMIAVECGNTQILKFLLENGAKFFGEQPEENLLDCVTRYSHVQDNVNTAMEIIHYCDENGGIDLLEKLMRGSILGVNGIMSKLVKEMPSIAYEILNRCFKRIDTTDFECTHEYNFFPITYGDKSKELDTIRSMVRHQRYKCLRHPVVVKFLDSKWNKSTARISYIVNIVVYAIFLFSMTTYIGFQMEGSYKITSPAMVGFSLVSILAIFLNILKEIVQMRLSHWEEYLLDPNNYLKWLIYISALVYLIPPIKEKTDEQIQAGAIAALLAWINFMWFFRILGLAIYIIMAKKVFVSLLKVLPMVSLFIFAFSIAFYLLMSSYEGFENIPNAILTTFAMMVGEIDYRDVFLRKKYSPYIALQRIFLFCFLIIITIVIMNLLIGLAVGDTDETMKRAKAERYYAKASVIINFQRSTFSWIQLRDVADRLEVNLNVKKYKKPWYAKLWEEVSHNIWVNDDNKELIRLSNDNDSPIIDEKAEKQIQLLESKHRHSDNEFAMNVNNQLELLSARQERLESSMDRITTALEKLTSENRCKVKIESDEKKVTETVL